MSHETIVDTVLAEKMLQLKISAMHFRIPAGEAWGTNPIRSRACCHIRPRT
jgi:hypothetical protein